MKNFFAICLCFILTLLFFPDKSLGFITSFFYLILLFIDWMFFEFLTKELAPLFNKLVLFKSNDANTLFIGVNTILVILLCFKINHLIQGTKGIDRYDLIFIVLPFAIYWLAKSIDKG